MSCIGKDGCEEPKDMDCGDSISRCLTVFKDKGMGDGEFIVFLKKSLTNLPILFFT
jgi:hypothetical protein